MPFLKAVLNAWPEHKSQWISPEYYNSNISIATIWFGTLVLFSELFPVITVHLMSLYVMYLQLNMSSFMVSWFSISCHYQINQGYPHPGLPLHYGHRLTVGITVSIALGCIKFLDPMGSGEEQKRVVEVNK